MKNDEIYVVRMFHLLDPPWVWKDMEVAFTTEEDAIQYGAKLVKDQENINQWTFTIVPFKVVDDFFKIYEMDIDNELE